MNYLRQILGSIFEISVMYMLLDCDIKLKKYRYPVGIYAAVILIGVAFAVHKLDYDSFMMLFPLLVYLPVFLAFVFISEFKAMKVLFVLLTAIGICISFTSIASVISYFFGSSNEMVNIIVFILYLPVWFLIYKFIRPSFQYMLRSSDKGWLGFCLIPLSYTVLIYSIGMFGMGTAMNPTMVKDAVLFFVLAFSAYYMIIQLFKQTREKITLQNEQNLLKTQVSAAQFHLEALQESQELTALYRHDMRHHLNLIDAYLADDNKAAAQKYISKVGHAIEDVVIEQYCSNYAVNLILSSSISKANNEKITVETHIELPEHSMIEDMDLCIIFANAIENATNACKGIENTKDRTLSILCKNKDDKLFIQITNSFAGSIKFDGDMPVSTIENHGLGAKSIAAVVQKYGGVYSFTAEDQVFCTSIIL